MKRSIILIMLILAVFSLSAEELVLDIMFTNDIHGGIDSYPATFINPDFPPQLGGGASAATYIKNIRNLSDESRNSLLVDAGDFFQGHPIGSKSEGKSIIKYMNWIGYDVMTIGNHEYDIGEEKLKLLLAMAEFPILSCNIVKKGTNELVDYATPFVIKEKMGLKIGIIGVTTTDTKKMSFPDHVKNIDFLSAKDALEKYVPIVKKKGADIVIVLGHMGLPYNPEPGYKKRYAKSGERKRNSVWGYDSQELAHEVEGIDIFFGGHMHKGFGEPWEDPNTHTLVFQGYAYGSNVGHVSIKIDKETKTVSGYEVPAIKEGVLMTLFEDEILPDKEFSEKIEIMQKEAEKGMDKIIGEAEIALSKAGDGAQNIMGNIVCESMLEATDADFTFINLGGLRGEITRGPVTHRDIFTVMPFDNKLILMTIDGNTLKKIIETRVAHGAHGLLVAGVKVTYNKNRDNFDRITRLIIGGEPWEADKMYKVVTTDFLMQGNARLDMLLSIPDEQQLNLGMLLRDAMVNYFVKNSPVSGQLDDRWIRDDKSELTKELSEALK
ncbi:MAG: bifunctional UDP-sugar hydrolase/5'-nucleotidase [Candidatus Cloacimonadota bacterium]|nr:bifunctional UDP-sugar hydrolase/5'-nucleotidase [Candidatus Cloacimonadota bacterium]